MSWLTDLRDDAGARCNAIGLSANFGLAVLKFTIGTIAVSEALIADGFNSAGDIVATSIAFAGYWFARQPADENHHYGHGNAENIAGLVVGAILLSTGVFVSIEGGRALLAGVSHTPSTLALSAAVVTVVVKEGLFRYTTAVGKALESPSLLASARDHRADVFIGFTVFAGVAASQAGMPWLDPLAALGIGLYIAFMAWEPIRANLGVLMDEAPEGLREEIFRLARAVEDVREADRIRIHPLGGHYVVDLEIYLDGSLPLRSAHEVAHRVQERILKEIPGVRDVQVHVNPTG